MSIVLVALKTIDHFFVTQVQKLSRHQDYATRINNTNSYVESLTISQQTTAP
jgi:hypothetical protein